MARAHWVRTLFDAAEMYGFGRRETILGAAPGAHDVLDTPYVATKQRLCVLRACWGS